VKKKVGSVHNVCFLENLNMKLECTGAGNLKINIPVKSMMMCHHIENADRKKRARSHAFAQLSAQHQLTPLCLPEGSAIMAIY